MNCIACHTDNAEDARFCTACGTSLASSCEGCSAKLYAALAKVDGVREIAVDTVLKTASVVVPQELEPARLEAVLTMDKYVARLRLPGE